MKVRFVSFSLFSFRFNRPSEGAQARITSMTDVAEATRLAARPPSEPLAMTPNPRQALLLDEVRERGS
ncbi:MAG: hypothetical protein ABW220_00350, partial [Burkholderiaceae bacterium]